MSYFKVPLGAFVFGVLGAFFFGGVSLAISVAVLAILELSLSFDNAIVNAHVLEHWDAKWRKLFLGVGIIVAVFGMRLVFPVVIVSATSGMPADAAFMLALDNPAEYAAKLTASHPLVAAFGGAFLAMVGLSFFMDGDKDHHWLPGEALLTKLGQIEAVQAAFTLAAVLFTAQFLPVVEQSSFIVAGILGVVTFVGTKALGTLLGGSGEGASKIIKAGIGGFLYLELLDASFSFDGVIGAFAITNNLIWISVGLGIGALAVRELTLLAVDRGTLAEFPFLPHGAFWAILSLAGLMLTSAVIEIPEAVTGLTGAALIGAAFISSLIANKRTAAATPA